MKRFAIVSALLLCTFLLPHILFAERTTPLIIDHACTDLSQIPGDWIEQAKAQLKWHYAHTSHGGQLISGLRAIQRQDSTFRIDHSTAELPTSADALCILDGMRPHANDDYITPNEYFSNDWNAPYHAHGLLNRDEYKGIINVSAFSWCRQMDGSGPSYDTIVDDYLRAMSQLEQDNPEVTFVYLTGNAQCGPDNHECSNLDSGYRRYIRNEQIRAYCRDNNKVLFDFADIESWWLNPESNVWDQATYEYTVGDQTMSVPYEHPQYNSGGCAHTSPENCENKGKAVWHLMARLAGWGDCIQAPSNLIYNVDDENHQVVLSWTDNSSDPNEDNFTIQRRVGDGQWVENFASVNPGVTTFTDTGLADGTFHYQVMAHLNDDGHGEPCNSQPSNVVTAQIGDMTAPVAPDGLAAQADATNKTIALTWNDNADSETGYTIERKVGTGAYALYHQTGQDVSTYLDDNKGEGPLADGTYTYRVAAFNDGGPSIHSNEATAEISTPGDTDSDGDGVPDNLDDCPQDRNKTEPGDCGCGTPDEDSDGDNTLDCNDQCPQDQSKTEPGACGCGTSDSDADDDNTPDCYDQCPDDPDKTEPGQCGCGAPETDPCNVRPRTPVMITPADESTDISRSPSLNADDFRDPDNGDTHAQTIWQIAINTEFDEPVYNETSDDHLTAFTVPEPLEAETTYYWRLCYVDSRGAQSEWPEPFSFTTGTEDISPDSPSDDDGGKSDGNGSSGCFMDTAGF